MDIFRELLAMNPAERANFLTNRPPATRARILAKVREYAALDANERELRLRATDLRWYVLSLLHESPTNRAARLATVPADLRPLVQSRLKQWDTLPPAVQQEFFESERALRYFSHVDPANAPVPPPLPPGAEKVGGNALSQAQRQKMAAQFNQFFELTPAEKAKTLNMLSDTERQQMEQTLQTFSQLSPQQRRQCIRGFAEFAGMSAAEKQDFLKNAQRWSQLSPKERQTWRDLVSHVPEWPPMPPEFLPPPPPMPSAMTRHPHPLVATNPN
ncbi:MAG TPA: DUF3106 domain-containing protein [Candidatus Acidoferrum sp.]|nr:DUF3106 domain-containing protein [Candidatus Acidoferrum sp.]